MWKSCSASFFCALKGKKSMFFNEKALPSGRKYNIME